MDRQTARRQSEEGAGFSGPQERATHDLRGKTLHTGLDTTRLDPASEAAGAKVAYAEQAVDTQHKLITAMLVGDPRVPEERYRLDQLYEIERAAKANQLSHPG